MKQASGIYTQPVVINSWQKLQPRRGRGRDEGGARGLAEMTSQGVDMKVREEVDQAEGAKDLGQ